MPEIASWGNHKFVVSPSVIQSFKDMSIKGSSETTDKTKDNQKYVERKAGEAAQVSFTVQLNALTGVGDVYGEANTYVAEAMEGKTEYMYLGPSKIIPAKMMLTSAEITEIVFAPGKGNVWISCEVRLTMKQGSAKEDGSPGGGGGGGSGGGYTARVYYSGASGAVQSITVTSQKSYADALKQANAKVPGNALWSGTRKPQAQQTQTPTITMSEARKQAAIAAGAAIVAAHKASEGKIQKVGLEARKNLVGKKGEKSN